jgi:hypothetical protein
VTALTPAEIQRLEAATTEAEWDAVCDDLDAPEVAYQELLLRMLVGQHREACARVDADLRTARDLHRAGRSAEADRLLTSAEAHYVEALLKGATIAALRRVIADAGPDQGDGASTAAGGKTS